MAQYRQPHHQHEFLPLCDVLFNIISLASYFCDIVFDLATVYALAHHPGIPSILFLLSVTLITISLVVSQVVSIRWYLWGARGKLVDCNGRSVDDVSNKQKSRGWSMGCVLLLHSAQAGVLWRYFKLFIPVDLTYVKHEVRELCVLRLIHAFCEAAPMLLLQLYLLFIGIDKDTAVETDDGALTKDNGDKLGKLTAVSAGLSLWSVCWAVASFSKGAARLRNLERLVLTWLGVLAQLVWRLGTVSARVGALVIYASLYGGEWLLVVMALHWVSMLTWLLLTPDGLFHGGERLPLLRKIFLASLLAFIYIFAYINLHETNHRQKMAIFYTVMFLENSLLSGIWAVGVNRSNLHFQQHQTHPFSLLLVLLALFLGGMFFMALYYRFFHVRRLRYEAGGRMTASNLTTLTSQDNVEEKHTECGEEKKLSINIGMRKVKLSNGGIPGVFNCRFANPTAVNANRKKKKPTSFVPPPPQSLVAVSEAKQQWLIGSTGSKQLIPFWKRPASCNNTVSQMDNINEQKCEVDVGTGGSLSVSSIREKLREKKQQQLRELRAIQKEIKEGKLFPPPSASTSSSPSVSNQQPPPNTKLHASPSSPLTDVAISLTASSPVMITEHINATTLAPMAWPPVKMHCLLPPPPASSYYTNSHTSNSQWKVSQRDRPDTPEILLAPRCLPHHYSHWTPPGNVNHRLRPNDKNEEDNKSIKDAGNVGGEAEVSDVEGSQVSLPRSYTLPREFKYNHSSDTGRERRVGSNKLPLSRFCLPSTNSSDGDVDSADNEEETDSEVRDRIRNCHQEYNSEESRPRQYDFESNEIIADLSNSISESSYSAINSVPHRYSNNGILRQSQPFRTARIKHETKL